MLTTPRDASELTVPTRDGVDLKVRWWAVPRPRGLVVVAHGLGEHGGAYAHLAEAIGPALEIDFIALDFRGHGRSPGRRGVVRRYEDLVGDLRAVVSWAQSRRPNLPLFMLGHSNGGQVVLRLALEGADGVAGVIASNPSIRIAMPVPPRKLKIGKVLLSLAPWITLRTDAPSAWMTRDPVMQQMYRSDSLRHNRISAPLFFGMVEGGEMLLARAGEIKAPVLMLIGGQDQVICPVSNRKFYDRLGSDDKTFLLYPKMLHEPLNELGRQQVFDDLARWLEPRIG
jgi:alpha-beta hydrolase superfamily lysophospholipase